MVVAVLDVAKGAAGVILAGQMASQGYAAALAGVAAVVGHIYPVWLRFRGGKGVATACGAFSVLAPLAVPPAFLAFVAAVWMTRYISVGSVVASIVLPPAAYFSGSRVPVVASAVAAGVLIVFRHRSNLRRVRAGAERRLEVRA